MHDIDLLVRQDRHWVHPVTALMQHEAVGPSIWKSAQGIHLTDIHGKRVQDAFSGLWCVNAGYGQPTIVQAAREQLERLPYATGYFHFASEEAEVVRSLAQSLGLPFVMGRGDVRERARREGLSLEDAARSQPSRF